MYMVRPRTPCTDENISATIKLIAVFLRGGARINAVDKVGRSALRYAVEGAAHENTSMIRYLLRRGANPVLKADDGQSPLSIIRARYPYEEELVRRLLEQAAGKRARRR